MPYKYTGLLRCIIILLLFDLFFLINVYEFSLSSRTFCLFLINLRKCWQPFLEERNWWCCLLYIILSKQSQGPFFCFASENTFLCTCIHFEWHVSVCCRLILAVHWLFGREGILFQLCQLCLVPFMAFFAKALNVFILAFWLWNPAKIFNVIVFIIFLSLGFLLFSVLYFRGKCPVVHYLFF